MPIKLNSTGGGSVTLDVPATGSTFNLTVPANNATLFTNSGGTVSGSLNVTGTVGINQTTPGDRLSVTGNVRMQAANTRLIGFDSSSSYQLGVSGGAAILFETIAGSQEIGFETHNTGFWHREHLRITKEGWIKKPYQPAFYASGPAQNLTLGNQGDLALSVARYNIGSHYNTSNYRFTAPVAGRYLFTWSVFVNSATGRCSLKLNGGSYADLQMDAGGGFSQAAILSLAVNDYVTVGDWQNLSGLQYWGSHSHFSGMLLG